MLHFKWLLANQPLSKPNWEQGSRRADRLLQHGNVCWAPSSSDAVYQNSVENNVASSSSLVLKDTNSLRETAVGLDELATHVGTRWWRTMQEFHWHDEEGSPEVARVKKRFKFTGFFCFFKSKVWPESRQHEATEDPPSFKKKKKITRCISFILPSSSPCQTGHNKGKHNLS